MEAVEERGGYTLLRVRVQPKASRNAICVEGDGRIRVALTAPPVEGAANKALSEFVAKTLGVSKGAVSLVGGEKSREKTIQVAGLSGAEVRARLALGPRA